MRTNKYIDWARIFFAGVDREPIADEPDRNEESNEASKGLAIGPSSELLFDEIKL
jgi:hypothetical protein